jgi:hypothetical protein
MQTMCQHWREESRRVVATAMRSDHLPAKQKGNYIWGSVGKDHTPFAMCLNIRSLSTHCLQGVTCRQKQGSYRILADKRSLSNFLLPAIFKPYGRRATGTLFGRL